MCALGSSFHLLRNVNRIHCLHTIGSQLRVSWLLTGLPKGPRPVGGAWRFSNWEKSPLLPRRAGGGVGTAPQEGDVQWKRSCSCSPLFLSFLLSIF